MKRLRWRYIGLLAAVVVVSGSAPAVTARPAAHEVEVTIDPALRTVPQIGELLLSGSLRSNDDVDVTLMGEVTQGSVRTGVGPYEVDLTGGYGWGFDAITEGREGGRFGPGEATVTLQAVDRADPTVVLGEAIEQIEIEAPRIAFHRSPKSSDDPESNEIYAMNEDGTDVVRLTRNNVADELPSFAAGGRWIAFTRNGDIYRMRSDGTRVRQVTAGRRYDALPDWSPDGRWIVFARFFSNRQSELFKIRSSGDGRAIRLTDTPAFEFAPAWSPVGDLIAYTKVHHEKLRQGIGIVAADGSGSDWLTNNPNETEGYSDGSPSWSPDGARVSFTREHSYEIYSDLFTVEVATGEVTQVTDLQALVEVPSWGPDDRIVFMHDQGLAIVSSDGSGLEMITPSGPGTRQYWWPDWAPASPLG